MTSSDSRYSVVSSICSRLSKEQQKVEGGDYVTTITITIVVDEGKPCALPKPGRMYVALIEELIMAKLNVWKVTLSMPEKAAADVVKRTLSFDPGNPALSGEVVQDIALGEAAPAQAEVVVLEGIPSTIITLIDTDNAGNNSPATTFDLSTVDTQAPPAPGEMGVLNVVEEIIDVPDPV